MKETRKQIVEQTRNEVARQYNTKVKELEERLKNLSSEYAELSKKFYQVKCERDEAVDKVKEYEDWNNRLMEFMDMPADAREKALEQERAKFAVNTKLENMLGLYDRFMNLMF